MDDNKKMNRNTCKKRIKIYIYIYIYIYNISLFIYMKYILKASVNE